jgi:hypothetical protein
VLQGWVACLINADKKTSNVPARYWGAARTQLNTWSYSELAELARRLAETAETVRNPAVYADLHQAAAPSAISPAPGSASKNSPHRQGRPWRCSGRPQQNSSFPSLS